MSLASRPLQRSSESRTQTGSDEQQLPSLDPATEPWPRSVCGPLTQTVAHLRRASNRRRPGDEAVVDPDGLDARLRGPRGANVVDPHEKAAILRSRAYTKRTRWSHGDKRLL